MSHSPLTQSELVARLGEVAAVPPHVPVDPLCLPPAEDDPALPPAYCDAGPGLQGKVRQRPRKIIVMALFGFEVPIFESDTTGQLCSWNLTPMRAPLYFATKLAAYQGLFIRMQSLMEFVL